MLQPLGFELLFDLRYVPEESTLFLLMFLLRAGPFPFDFPFEFLLELLLILIRLGPRRR